VAAASAAASPSSSAAAAATAASYSGKGRGNGLSSLSHNCDELVSELVVARGEKRVGCAHGAGAPRAPDSVHVLFQAAREIVVDDVLDILDILHRIGPRQLCIPTQALFGHFCFVKAIQSTEAA